MAAGLPAAFRLPGGAGHPQKAEQGGRRPAGLSDQEWSPCPGPSSQETERWPKASECGFENPMSLGGSQERASWRGAAAGERKS